MDKVRARKEDKTASRFWTCNMWNADRTCKNAVPKLLKRLMGKRMSLTRFLYLIFYLKGISDYKKLCFTIHISILPDKIYEIILKNPRSDRLFLLRILMEKQRLKLRFVFPLCVFCVYFTRLSNVASQSCSIPETSKRISCLDT